MKPSAEYWEDRYASGHGSGDGSRGAQALFKATFVNDFIRDNHVESVVELGSGDGYQAGLLEAPSYVGFDVSETAVNQCRAQYADDPRRSFFMMHSLADGGARGWGPFDVALSLDVIYHLVEDSVYDDYLEDLFRVAGGAVILYTSDLNRGASNEGTGCHVRHRTVAADIEDAGFPFALEAVVDGMDGVDFYVYRSTH